MRTEVNFESEIFPPTLNEEDETNPGIWGKNLAVYLVKKLKSYNIQIEDYYPEDWGWEIALRNDHFPIYIGCTNEEESEKSFRCIFTPNKQFIRKWFKKIDTTNDMKKITDIIDSILHEDVLITKIRWEHSAHPKSI